MAIRVVQQSEAASPVERAFEYVDDWRNVSDWLVGVETFTPVGDKDQGLGSVFDVVLHAGVKLKTRLQVTDYVERRLIEFESVKGFKMRNRWNFERVDEGRTLVTSEVELHPPLGPAGTAMAKVMEPAIRKIMERSSSRLTARLESA